MSLKRRIATSATISILLEGNIDDHAAAGELVMRQWGARFPLWTLANWKTQVFAGIGTQMPVSVVAKSENRVVGVVSLKNFGMDPEDPEGQLYSHLQPWVSYLVVSPTFRGGGCGSALVVAIEQLAKELKIPQLYLFTANAEGLYLNLGWETMKYISYKEVPRGALMTKKL